jgi:hypothetical protein
MTDRLVISNVETFRVIDETTQLNALAQIDRMFARPAKKIYLLCSCEISFLGSENLFNWLMDICNRYTTIPFSLISLGCVSFHAALLDFTVCPEENAIVILLDGPQATMQRIIDCLGVGTDGLAGLRSCESYAVCRLDKNPTNSPEHASWVKNVQVLSRIEGKYSSLDDAKKLLMYIKNIRENEQTKVVSFRNNTHWSNSLLQSLQFFKNESQISADSWLPSIEQTHDHYHAAKPLIELQKYLNSLSEWPLIIITLAGFGRLGVLQVSSQPCMFIKPDNIEKLVIEQSSERRLDNLKSLQTMLHDQMIDGNSVHEALFCMKKKYAFMDNFYFEWAL